MNLIKMDRPICMIASLSMLLDVPIPEILERMPYKADEARSHHIQELLDVADYFGQDLIFIEPYPEINGVQVFSKEKARARLIWHMIDSEGLVAVTPTHMCAWDGKLVHDPNGKLYPINYDSVYFFLKARKRSW